MLRIFVANKAGRSGIEHAGGPLELGRGPRRDLPRLTIDDPYFPNNQLRIEEAEGDRARLENLHNKAAVQVIGGTPLGPGDIRVVPLPVRLSAGETLIDIEPAGLGEEIERASLRSVEPPVRGSASPTITPLVSLGDAPDAERLARWFETLIAVQRSAASSPGFYDEAARAVVELIGLDYGTVLLRKGDGWEVVARHGTNPSRGAEFSRTVLGFVGEERRTFYQVLSPAAATRSQLGGSAVVAAPVLGGDGREVIGAVYGVRAPRPEAADPAVRPLEAQLVQVLAAAVGAGLARLESEDRAARRHRQFTDFMSPELALELDRDPRLLDGQRREVTVLFSDIRGFSTASERLSPEATCELVRDVLECLTRRIRDHRGVVVDYIGDAVMAMWNAPADQADHAALACRAALAMREEVAGLNERWRDRIGGPFALGIGMNTGPALVGNTGSRSRLKYGPLGHAVNLASRVEGATKHLGVPLLITGATHAALGDHGFATRRLCRVEVVGIKGPVDLYELHAAAVEPAWRAWRDAYEAGLRHFEAGELTEACQVLHGLLEGRKGHYDLPTLSLVGRAIEQLRNPSRPFSPVLKLESK
jgi:adenylate cyclase